MNIQLFSFEINAILTDDTEIFNAKGFVIDNKRVYKNDKNEILSGQKKIKEIKSQTVCVPPQLFELIMLNIKES
tara:strand:+ start:4745 stop:4966 length:222 start_codon:yes stop_codon:yes gene_type:complete